MLLQFALLWCLSGQGSWTDYERRPNKQQSWICTTIAWEWYMHANISDCEEAGGPVPSGEICLLTYINSIWNIISGSCLIMSYRVLQLKWKIKIRENQGRKENYFLFLILMIITTEFVNSSYLLKKDWVVLCLRPLSRFSAASLRRKTFIWHLSCFQRQNIQATRRSHVSTHCG